MSKNTTNKDEFDKGFQTIFSFMLKTWVAWVVSAVVSAIAGLALVAAIIYLLIKIASVM